MARRTALLLRCAARLQGRLGRRILLRDLLGHASQGAGTGRRLSYRERNGRYAAVAQAEGIGLEDGVPQRAAQHGSGAGRGLGIHHAARPLVSRLYADRPQQVGRARFGNAAGDRPDFAVRCVPLLGHQLSIPDLMPDRTHHVRHHGARGHQCRHARRSRSLRSFGVHAGDVLAWITRGRVLPIITDAAQLLVSIDAMKAAAVGLFKPKGHKFKGTAKGGERDRLKVQWALIVRFLLPLLLATLGAVAYGTFYVLSPVYGNQNAPIWLFWSYYNAIVIAVTIFTCIELPRRKTEGFRVDEMARLTIGPLMRQHQLQFLSTSWAMLSGRAAVPLGAWIVLQLQGVSEPLSARVSKLGKDNFEVTFETTPSLHEAIIRKLFSGRYQLRPARFRFSDVIIAVAGRLAS